VADRFQTATEIDVPAADVFDWHTRPGAFERLTPPWDSVRVVSRDPTLSDGSRVVLQVKTGPIRLRWTSIHRDIVPGRQFCDEQEGGPFRLWRHEHRFVPLDANRTRLEDDISFELPLGPIGSGTASGYVHRRLSRMFRYRHSVTKADLEAHARYSGPRLAVGITGASGLIGTELIPLLTTGGHRVTRLARDGRHGPDALPWDPQRGLAPPAGGQELDAVVHLAGANVGGKRWTDAWKREIRNSRVGPTRALAESLARLPRPPRTLVCASAIGFYGHRPGEDLTEASLRGTGFLSEVCQAWEEAAAPAEDAGIRVVHLRIGIVLSKKGGALQRMLPPFLAGVGGPVGDGRADFSWVALDDVLGAVLHALCSGVRGVVNVTAPSPVTSGEFAATLARVLRRPAVFKVPAAAVRLAFGEMGDALLLSSARVLPEALDASGYVFRFPDLEPALRHLLGRASSG
jgi:uncharacterized protein (TIGR01777 family)